MRSLNSGNCIKLLDVHDTYRGRHLVMEYATGGSLFAYARKMKYLDEEECKEVFRQVARGLKALHDAGACHRDIKMENILFGHDKLLKLADFGLAAMVGDPEKKFNDVCGSLLYVRSLVAGGWWLVAGGWGVLVSVCVRMQLTQRYVYTDGPGNPAEEAVLRPVRLACVCARAFHGSRCGASLVAAGLLISGAWACCCTCCCAATFRSGAAPRPTSSE